MKKSRIILFFLAICLVACNSWTVVNPDDESGNGSSIVKTDTLVVNGDTIVVDPDSIGVVVGDSAYVYITYNGSEAEVTSTKAVQDYITAYVNGSHVSIVQSENVGADNVGEIAYILSGTSSAGSFYLSGSYKSTIILNSLSLTCPDSAAINIKNGKRIALVINGDNTLVDGTSGEQKACLNIKGHPELSGSGTLTLTGNTKHALKTGEYLQLKKKFTGSIVVKNAVGDGLHIGQYLEMNNGSITVEKAGDDCIQVEQTDDSTDEQNGYAIINGGTLNLTVTAAGNDTSTVKGLKADNLIIIDNAIGNNTSVNITCTSSATAAKCIASGSDLTINGGTFNLSTAGNGKYDTKEKKTKASACLKSDAGMTINGGTFTLKSTGTGGKGISCDGDLNINGGDFSITTTGARYSYGSSSGGGWGGWGGGSSSSSSNNRSSAKGIKADGNLTISDGTINVSATGGEGSEGIESKSVLTINGGTIESYCYDDALQASGNILIKGGTIYARATNNDAIDSNSSIIISGGTTIAYATATPETPLDVDSPGYLQITGGTVLCAGLYSSNMTPYPNSSSTQPTVFYIGTVSSTNYVLTSGSTNIMDFKPEVSGGSSSSGGGGRGPGGGGMGGNQYFIMVSSPSLVKGSSATLYTGATVSGDTWHGLYTSPSISKTGTSVASVTSVSTPYSTLK